MRLWPVVSGVAWRTLKNALTNPQILLPTSLVVRGSCRERR